MSHLRATQEGVRFTSPWGQTPVAHVPYKSMLPCWLCPLRVQSSALNAYVFDPVKESNPSLCQEQRKKNDLGLAMLSVRGGLSRVTKSSGNQNQLPGEGSA